MEKQRSRLSARPNSSRNISINGSFSQSFNDLRINGDKSILDKSACSPSTNRLNNSAVRRCKSAGPTPRKTPNGKSFHSSQSPVRDRFIPNRSGFDVDRSHFLIHKHERNKDKDNKRSDDDSDGEDDVQISHTALSELLNGDESTYRIMSCVEKPPPPPEGHANHMKVLYSSNKKISTVRKAPRYIPSQPERILDAPDIKNDYYLQLIDWSSTNILAVALTQDVYLWNALSGGIEHLLHLPDSCYVSSVSWISTGQALAVGTSEGEVQLWDASKTKKIRTMAGHSSRVGALSWNSHNLSSGSRTGVIHHHDVRTYSHHVGTLFGHTQEICGLKWSPNGQYLASGANDNLVNVWSNSINHDRDNSNKLVHSFNDHCAAVKAVAWCPWKDNLLATGGGTADRHIRVWNTSQGTKVCEKDTESQVCGILWSKEHKELISAHGYAKNELSIWKYPDTSRSRELSKMAELLGHTSRILGICSSPDGVTVVSVGADETLRFWDCFQYDAETKKKTALAVTKRAKADNPLLFTLR